MNFLQQLQSLNEPTKRRVLIGVTIIVMLIVIYVWLGYFNNLIAGIPQTQQVAQGDTSTAPAAAAGPTAAAPKTSGPGMWQNMKNGMANIYSAITGSHDYSIQPK